MIQIKGANIFNDLRIT